MNIPSLIGPQIYGSPKPNRKCISVNIDLDYIHSTNVINFTGYTWVDQKYRFALGIIATTYSKLIIHDSDFLGILEYAKILIQQKHTVVFVLQPKEWSVRNMGSRGVFGGAPASNSRIRGAYNVLKSLGVSVKKFQSPLALEKYLLKKAGAK